MSKYTFINRIAMDENGVNSYFDISTGNNSYDVSIIGKVESRLGIGMDIGISILSKDFASVNLGGEFGIYGDMLSTLSTSFSSQNKSVDDNFVGKIEAGMYFKSTYTATLNVVFFKCEYEGEICDEKRPFFKIEVDTTKENETDETSSSVNTGQSNNSINSAGSSTSNNASTESKSKSSTTLSETDIYNDFIKNKKYTTHTSQWEETANVEGYCIFDINKDGTNELLIMSDNLNVGWRYTLIYTYNKTKNSVILIENIYSYGEVRYDDENSGIVYTEVKPFYGTFAYGCYKLENEKFVLSRNIGQDEGEYFISINGTKQTSTSEKNEEYFSKLIDFNFTSI